MKKIFLLMALCCMSVFCAKAAEAYVVFDGDHTLTYYYDDNRTSWKNDGYITEVYSDWDTPFHEGYNDKVELIVVDESMKNANLNRMRFFFGGPNGDDTNLSALTTIYGMENLNTANVTDMACMFFGCKSLTTVDLSGFNTANVTDMSNMFEGCKSLTSIDVSAFNTANVTDMSRMFMSCISLKDIDLSGFNTANVTEMNDMFYECSSLTSLDVTNFKMDKVGSAGSMFSQCLALQTIYCNDDWSQNEVLEESEYMFLDCWSLKGGNGTEYRDFKDDKTYARPDGGAEAPGYFTEKVMDPIVEEDGWVHYDNGENVGSIGLTSGGLFYWSVMIPAGTVSDWFLTKVSLYVQQGRSGELTLSIYQGGSEPMAGDLLHSQVVTVNAEDDFQVFDLTPSVLINPSQDLWIVFANTGNVSYPASYASAPNAPHARWIAMLDSDGNVIWSDVKEYGYDNIAWMVRGHFASEPEYHPYAVNIAASDIMAHSANISWEGYETFDLRYKKHVRRINNNFANEDLNGWTTIDADGDGHEWEFAITVDGLLRVGSASYKNGGIGALTPDNYLVSPRFKIGDYISFKAYGVDINDFAEHFGVAVSTTSNTDPDAFTTIWETTMDEAKTWKQYTVDLRAYKGQEGYVAIRHFDCTNQYWLLVNDIMVYPNPDTEEEPDWTVVENLKTDAYELSGLEPESEYWVQIKAYHGEEETEWSPVYKFVTAVSEEGIESVSSSDFRGQKVLREGQLMIIRGEKTYNVLGTEVK